MNIFTLESLQRLSSVKILTLSLSPCFRLRTHTGSEASL